MITFQPGTETREVLQLRKLCHCVIWWEKFQNSRPIRQCFNCQDFGHSSNFCGRPPKCVKCDKQHASKDCNKPTNAPPTCTNCGGEHPAKYTGCPQYLQQLNHIPPSPKKTINNTANSLTWKTKILHFNTNRPSSQHWRSPNHPPPHGKPQLRYQQTPPSNPSAQTSNR